MFNEELSGTEKMAQWLGTLTALAEDLGLVPHTQSGS